MATTDEEFREILRGVVENIRPPEPPKVQKVPTLTIQESPQPEIAEKPGKEISTGDLMDYLASTSQTRFGQREMGTGLLDQIAGGFKGFYRGLVNEGRSTLDAIDAISSIFTTIAYADPALGRGTSKYLLDKIPDKVRETLSPEDLEGSTTNLGYKIGRIGTEIGINIAEMIPLLRGMKVLGLSTKALQLEEAARKAAKGWEVISKAAKFVPEALKSAEVGLGMGAFGAAKAAVTPGATPWQVTEAGLTNLLLGTVIHNANQLARVPGTLAAGAVGAGASKLLGKEDWEDALIQGGMFAGLRAIGPKHAARTIIKLQDLGYPIEDISKMSWMQGKKIISEKRPPSAPTAPTVPPVVAPPVVEPLARPLAEGTPLEETLPGVQEAMKYQPPFAAGALTSEDALRTTQEALARGPAPGRELATTETIEGVLGGPPSAIAPTPEDARIDAVVNRILGKGTTPETAPPAPPPVTPTTPSVTAPISELGTPVPVWLRKPGEVRITPSEIEKEVGIPITQVPPSLTTEVPIGGPGRPTPIRIGEEVPEVQVPITISPTVEKAHTLGQESYLELLKGRGFDEKIESLPFERLASLFDSHLKPSQVAIDVKQGIWKEAKRPGRNVKIKNQTDEKLKQILEESGSREATENAKSELIDRGLPATTEKVTIVDESVPTVDDIPLGPTNTERAALHKLGYSRKLLEAMTPDQRTDIITKSIKYEKPSKVVADAQKKVEEVKEVFKPGKSRTGTVSEFVKDEIKETESIVRDLKKRLQNPKITPEEKRKTAEYLVEWSKDLAELKEGKVSEIEAGVQTGVKQVLRRKTPVAPTPEKTTADYLKQLGIAEDSDVARAMLSERTVMEAAPPEMKPIVETYSGVPDATDQIKKVFGGSEKSRSNATEMAAQVRSMNDMLQEKQSQLEVLKDAVETGKEYGTPDLIGEKAIPEVEREIKLLQDQVKKASAALKVANKESRKLLATGEMKIGDTRLGSDFVTGSPGQEVGATSVVHRTESGDHFTLITNAENKLPNPGDQVQVVGKAKVVYKNKVPTLVDYDIPVDTPFRDFFQRNLKSYLNQFYGAKGETLAIEGAGKNLPSDEPGGITLRMGVGPMEAVKAAQHLGSDAVGWIANWWYKMRESRPEMIRGMTREQISQLRKDVANYSVDAPDPNLTARLSWDAEKNPYGQKYMNIADLLGDLKFASNEVVRFVGKVGTDIEASRQLGIRWINEQLQLISNTARESGRDYKELARDFYDVMNKKPLSSKKPLDPALEKADKMVSDVLESVARQRQMKEKGQWRKDYFPFITDPNEFYKLIRNYLVKLDLPYDSEKAPKWLWDTMSPNDHVMIKEIMNRNETWEEVPEVQKEIIQRKAFSWNGVFPKADDMPWEMQVELKRPEKYYNPHEQPRDGSPSTPLTDGFEVLKRYLYTMNRVDHGRKLLEQTRKVINSYGDSTNPISIGGYLQRYVRGLMGEKTIAQQTAEAMARKLNVIAGHEWLDRNWLDKIASRTTRQVAAGALSPSSWAGNLNQGVQILVDKGAGNYGKAVLEMAGKVKEYAITGEDPLAKQYPAWDLYNVTKLGPHNSYDPITGNEVQIKGLPGKVLKYYDMMGNIATRPMQAVEFFNKGTALVAGMKATGDLGMDFNRSVRVNVVKISDMMPDFTVPLQQYNAVMDAFRSQYHYEKVGKSPLLRGPLAAMSTIFWSYPLKTIQFIRNGIGDSAVAGDNARLFRFVSYLGMQLTIAQALAQLGFDVSNWYGKGVMPYKPMSLPWEILYQGYQTTFGGGDLRSKEKAMDTLGTDLGVLMIPGYRTIAKTVRLAENIHRGYRTAGDREHPLFETTPIEEVLSFFGWPTSTAKEAYAELRTLSEARSQERALINEYTLKAAKYFMDGKEEKGMEVLENARAKGIPVTPGGARNLVREWQTKTMYEQRMRGASKELKARYKDEIDAINRRMFPSRYETETEIRRPGKGSRGMWSGSGVEEVEEEE